MARTALLATVVRDWWRFASRDPISVRPAVASARGTRAAAVDQAPNKADGDGSREVTMAATEVLVRDVIEARCRRVMAQRAAIKLRYDTRAERDRLLVTINDELERFNLLVLGR